MGRKDFLTGITEITGKIDLNRIKFFFAIFASWREVMALYRARNKEQLRTPLPPKMNLKRSHEEQRENLAILRDLRASVRKCLERRSGTGDFV